MKVTDEDILLITLSFKRRHLFLEQALKYYLDPKTKGRIIGS